MKDPVESFLNIDKEDLTLALAKITLQDKITVVITYLVLLNADNWLLDPILTATNQDKVSSRSRVSNFKK